eukprot:13950023-Alexandrium_andersonii.AAC.1
MKSAASLPTRSTSVSSRPSAPPSGCSIVRVPEPSAWKSQNEVHMGSRTHTFGPLGSRAMPRSRCW